MTDRVPIRPIQLRELLVIDVAVLAPIELDGARRCIPFAGGRFSGRDGLAGVVLDGGVDWQTRRIDGVLEIDAHYALRTDAGDAIEVRSTGLRKAAPDVVERLARGDAVDPDEYYFRTHIRLTAAAPSLAWMNDMLAVSTGVRERDIVHIHVHEVR
jgi:hypothetical protein